MSIGSWQRRVHQLRVQHWSYALEALDFAWLSLLHTVENSTAYQGSSVDRDYGT
jgi:hypothetical protein